MNHGKYICIKCGSMIHSKCKRQRNEFPLKTKPGVYAAECFLYSETRRRWKFSNSDSGQTEVVTDFSHKILTAEDDSGDRVVLLQFPFEPGRGHEKDNAWDLREDALRRLIKFIKQTDEDVLMTAICEHDYLCYQQCGFDCCEPVVCPYPQGSGDGF